jgi:GntR family transcriptional regulator
MGQWAPGVVLPGEVELAAQFGVAVGTVRHALAALVAEGLLARRPRLGTVVTGRSPEHSLRFFFRYFRLHGIGGSLQRSQPRTLALEDVPADPEDAAALNLTPGSALIRIHRLRLVEGRPIMADLYRIPASRVPGFPRESSALPELLFLHLLDTWGIRITAVREELRAEVATLADREHLGLPDPSALLVIDAAAFDQGGHPCLLATSRASTDAHRYINEVQ